MGKVQIVTDSNAFLAQDALVNHNVDVIPHRIKIGSSFFEEAAGFTAEKFFLQLQEAQDSGVSNLPDVHAADVNTILDCYRQLGQQSEQIVSIHMSSELSPMWMQARKAAEMLKGRYSIRVIDSLSTSYGLGLLVEQAAEAAEKGASVNEIARIANGAVPHLYVAIFSESLNFLERSAHLGPSQSLLGTMLGIKAMLMMEEGQLVPLEKVQTRDEVIEKLYDFVTEFAHVQRVGIMQHAYEHQQDALVERLAEVLPDVSVQRLTLPPSLAAYVGPNMIGVVVYEGTF